MSSAAETSILFSQDGSVIGDPSNGFSGVVWLKLEDIVWKINVLG